jgi:hypothetical protein
LYLALLVDNHCQLLRFEFEKTGKEKYAAGGIGTLYIDDVKVGEAQKPQTIMLPSNREIQ